MDTYERAVFKYWFKLYELELILLRFVKSLRTLDSELFVSSLEKIVPWMFSMDHIHYPRWLPVFINDLKMLKDLHPMVGEEYAKGHFTFNKTKKRFSSLPIDQAHEQNNKLVKIEGGAVGILENHTSLMKWMVDGPEINKMLNAFDLLSSEKKDSHFEDNDSHETDFRKDVLSSTVYSKIREIIS